MESDGIRFTSLRRRHGRCSSVVSLLGVLSANPMPALRPNIEAAFHPLAVVKRRLTYTKPEAPHERSVNYRIRLEVLPVESQHETPVRHGHKFFDIAFDGHRYNAGDARPELGERLGP